MEKFAIAFGALSDFPDLGAIVARCDPPKHKVTAPPIELAFPKFREDGPDIEALAEYLWFQAINYVVPLRKRRQAQTKTKNSATGADMSWQVRLVAEAKRAFIEYREKHPNRASEVGELLAYLLVLEYLKAAQIASKMALKTNSNMPVHGLDGIHASFLDGVMTLYFLESKLTKTAKSGLNQYAKSLSDFGDSRDKYLLEYEIISELGNLSALSDEDRETAMEYLDVYGKKKAQRIERSVGIICYSEDKFSEKLPKSKDHPPLVHENNFKKHYESMYAEFHKAALDALTAKGIDPADCELFLFAVPDVTALREMFCEKMNG